MNNVVTVAAHPTTGAIVTPSKKEGWGSVRLTSTVVSYENGIRNKSSRSAFIRGEIADLMEDFKKVGQIIAGKIIKEESFEPFYAGQSPKINPQTQQLVLTNGRPTYLNFKFTQITDAMDCWVGAKETSAQVTTQAAIPTIEVEESPTVDEFEAPMVAPLAAPLAEQVV